MKIFAKIAFINTIVIFIVLCFNVMYLEISILVRGVGVETEMFYPAVGALIPIILLLDMISIFYACDYEDNLRIYSILTKNDKIKIAIYVSLGLINPMLLYIHTKSFNHLFKMFGILRCFPIINIFMYLKLIKRLKYKGCSMNDFIIQYFKGILILTIIKEDIR